MTKRKEKESSAKNKQEQIISNETKGEEIKTLYGKENVVYNIR